MKTVFVIAAHPDDELLGVGGCVAKHVKAGDKVYGLILGEGQTSRWEHREEADKAVVEALHKDTLDAAAEVGFQKIFFENFPDNRFDQADLLDIVKSVEKYIREWKPEIVYTHFLGDLNVDHQMTAKAVLTATRPIGEYSVQEIYAFETLSSTEWNFDKTGQTGFVPNVFVDITEEYAQKEAAMKHYQSELCEFPHPRSLEGMDVLSRTRGMAAGMKRAEAFQLIRKTVK